MTIKEIMVNLENLQLPERGEEGTSDPLFIVYDRTIKLSEKVFYVLEDDDRVEYLQEAGEWIFTGTYDKDSGNYKEVPDEWFVEEGYAVWEQRFYGVFLTREEAKEAIEKRHYALNNPYIFCESMCRSSNKIKQLFRLYEKNIKNETEKTKETK